MSPSAALNEASYVLTLDEISHLTQEGGKPAETLMNVVALIAKRFQTDVCSAYLLEPDRANLVLAATLGLRRECIGTLRLALHEGLAGLVAEQVRPVAVEQVKLHPRFKFFGESGEERYPVFPRRSADRSRRAAGCAGGPDGRIRGFSASEEIRMLTLSRRAGGAGGERSAHARTVHRARCRNGLWALARNLWWSWDHDSISIFRDLDPVRWRRSSTTIRWRCCRNCPWR